MPSTKTTRTARIARIAAELQAIEASLVQHRWHLIGWGRALHTPQTVVCRIGSNRGDESITAQGYSKLDALQTAYERAGFGVWAFRPDDNGACK